MNEETKDTRMLPVQCNCAWNPDRHADTCPVNLRDRLTDAQARLAEKDARIAQLAAHARGKNKALANALKEIERLKERVSTRIINLANANIELTDLRAQLAQLQAAPAGRGAPDETAMARALCNYHADLCGVNRDDQWNLFSEDFLNDVAVMLAADRRLNPAPATADSDVREVKS